MNLEKVKKVLFRCRVMAIEGLGNTSRAFIPNLTIDVIPKSAFLGIHKNPAIFVTKITYEKLKKFHRGWSPNLTIAIKENYFNAENNQMNVIGAIVHEAGHAFNVYAKIKNNETNAYIFEIEMLHNLYHHNVLHDLFGITDLTIQTYFKNRMAYYQLGASKSPYLQEWIDQIKTRFSLEAKSSQAQEYNFFKEKKWSQELGNAPSIVSI